MKRKSLSLILFICILLCSCNTPKKASVNETMTNIPENKPQIEKPIIEEPVSEDKGALYRDIAVTRPAKIDGSVFIQPILQNPTDTTITVQWFTEEEGTNNFVTLYEDGQESRKIIADTFRMSRMRGGKTQKDLNNQTKKVDIYKHVAVVDNLPQYHGYVSERVDYNVTTDEQSSEIFSLAAKPSKGTAVKILLTSDLQNKDMCAANFQKVYETVGNVDAIWIDGDLSDVTDRAYDWFYSDNSFWKVFTGTADDTIGSDSYSTQYYGAPLAQQAPIYAAIGNHDVMGRYDEVNNLAVQFNNPSTIEHANMLYELSSASIEDKDAFIADNSFNTITYEEMFELPESEEGKERYYAVTFGDIRLICLELARVWRLPSVGVLGKYSEIPGANEFDYGFGDFIFEPIKEGSKQYNFLQSELKTEEYSNAQYRVVMFHNALHSLGENSAPAFTDPVPDKVKDPVTGKEMTIYTYPLEDDYIKTIVEPMLEDSHTNLMFEGHSHIWNRFVTDSGMNVLETSNVGNSYGAYEEDSVRGSVPQGIGKGEKYYSISDKWSCDDYIASYDPFGLEPVKPNKKDLPDGKSNISSNNLTVFSIFDTGSGCIDSYYFDTTNPDAEVILFDSFKVN